MGGFKTIKAWSDTEADGRSWLSFFRKVPASTATITGQWFDYSTASGVPVPNYYASSPLVAARLNPQNGIFVPEQSTARWLRKSITMSAAAGVTSITNQNQSLMLLDYLLYYPFIDLDAAGEEQTMNNSVAALDRYTDGVGVKMMIVAQAPTVGGGNYTVKYIGSDDVEYTTSTIYCPAAQPSGALVSSVTAAAGISPFIPLNINVRGVKRVVSVTVGVANGGLAAIVLVKPFQISYVREESRRPTSSPTESYGDATEIERVRMLSGSGEVKANAFLGWIGCGVAGSLASAPLVGVIETIWSN